MTYLLFDMTRYYLTPLAAQALGTACGVVGLGILAVVRERGALESTRFFKLTLTIGLWLFGFSWMYASGYESTAMWWAKVAYIGIACIPAAAFDFSVMMLQDYEQARRKGLLIWIFSGLFIAANFAADLQFGSMYRYEWGYYPKCSLTGIPFMFFFLGVLIFVLNRYVKAYRSAPRGSVRWKHARIILLAYITSNIGVVDFLPSWGVPLYPFGYVALILFIFINFYCISRYRFVAITPSFAVNRIIEIMNDGLIVLDREGLVRVVNRSFCELFGYAESALIGRRPAEAMAGGHEFGARLEKTLENREPGDFEIESVGTEGNIRTFSLHASIMRDQRGEEQATVCVVRDVTERKRAEAERESLIAQLREALANVKQLRGLVPICASCKKIRDDEGYWQQIECYISAHTEAEFTHGLCPECAEKAFAELDEMEIEA